MAALNQQISENTSKESKKEQLVMIFGQLYFYLCWQ